MQRNRKNKALKLINLTAFAGLIIALGCCKLLAYPVKKVATPKFGGRFSIFAPQDNSADSQNSELKIPGLNPKVLKLALKAHKNAKENGIGSKDILTIVDYSLPSTERRMWVIDLENNKVLHHTLVAHGSGSGQNYATAFSNKPGSYMSSIGMYVTGKIYHGNHGVSLNMHGLEEKFNSNAFARRIVVHGAHYVDEHIIPKIGRLGRSWGCLALSNKVAKKIMDTIKDGSYIFCYYPDQTWLKQSKFLSK